MRRNRNFTLFVDAYRFERGLNVICGPNGAGKSTLLECLIGQRRRNVSHLVIDGVPLRDQSSRNRVYSRLGYVPQSLILPRSWRVSEYLAYAGWLKGLDSAAVAQKGTDLTRILEIDPKIRIRTLSGGFGRRLMIAQALMSSPTCLVLDEPSVGLDAASQDLLVGLISDVAQIGTVIATDHTGQLAPHADHLVQLTDGRIAS